MYRQSREKGKRKSQRLPGSPRNLTGQCLSVISIGGSVSQAEGSSFGSQGLYWQESAAPAAQGLPPKPGSARPAHSPRTRRTEGSDLCRHTRPEGSDLCRHTSTWNTKREYPGQTSGRQCQGPGGPSRARGNGGGSVGTSVAPLGKLPLEVAG